MSETYLKIKIAKPFFKTVKAISKLDIRFYTVNNTGPTPILMVTDGRALRLFPIEEILEWNPTITKKTDLFSFDGMCLNEAFAGLTAIHKKDDHVIIDFKALDQYSAPDYRELTVDRDPPKGSHDCHSIGLNANLLQTFFPMPVKLEVRAEDQPVKVFELVENETGTVADSDRQYLGMIMPIRL